MSQYTNYYNQLCGDINKEYERKKREESKAVTKLCENTEQQIPNGVVRGPEVKLLFSHSTVLILLCTSEIITRKTLFTESKRSSLPHLTIHFLKPSVCYNVHFCNNFLSHSFTSKPITLFNHFD